jgi:hypothetical protein
MADLTGKVEDDVDTVQQRLNATGVADVAAHQAKVVRHRGNIVRIRAAALKAGIDEGDARPEMDQFNRQITANEAETACDENPFASIESHSHQPLGLFYTVSENKQMFPSRQRLL